MQRPPLFLYPNLPALLLLTCPTTPASMSQGSSAFLGHFRVCDDVPTLADPGHEALMHELSRLLETGELSDLTLHLHGETFHLHR